MRNSHAKRSPRRLAMLAALCCAFAALPLLSSARASTASINVVNNSGREIINLYLSPADSDNWGPDQLGDAHITTGQSFTISNITCDQPQIKVVAEDKDGCFLSAVVSCGNAATWTITNDTAADCGL